MVPPHPKGTTMTAQIPHITAPVPAPRRRRGDGQIAAIIAGAVLTVLGLVGVVAGGSVLAVFGSDGTANSGTHTFSTPTAALVSGAADLTDSSQIGDFTGDPKVRFSVTSQAPGKPVFVGIGPADQVDRYLTGAPVDEVTDVDMFPFKLKRDRHAGTRRLAAPGSQTFWVAQNEGPRSASLRWKVRDGDYRVVVMNADGTRDVTTKGELELTAPNAPAIGWSVLGVGTVVLLGGVVASVYGMRRKRED
jgi:hypothetical protein